MIDAASVTATRTVTYHANHSSRPDGLQRQRHVFGRAAEQRVADRVGEATPSARTCGGNISALTTPLIDV